MCVPISIYTLRHTRQSYEYDLDIIDHEHKPFITEFQNEREIPRFSKLFVIH